MAKAEKVVLDKSGSRVRLRNLPFALEGCISGDEDGKAVEIRYRIEPNKWTNVHPLVYAQLKRKFDEPRYKEVPDWEPGGENQRSERTPRIEEQQEYIIEFA